MENAGNDMATVTKTSRNAYKRDWAAKNRKRVHRSQKRYRVRLAKSFAGRREIVRCRCCPATGPRSEICYPSTGLICKECFKKRVKARAATRPERVRKIHKASYDRRHAENPEVFRDYCRMWRLRKRRDVGRLRVRLGEIPGTVAEG
jgi:hypothetical protein